MRKSRKTKLILAIFLVITLLIPQGVTAAQFAGYMGKQPSGVSGGRQDESLKGKVKEGEIIFKVDGGPASEAEILKKYGMSLIRRDSRLGYVLASSRGRDSEKIVSQLRKEKLIKYAQPNYLYTLMGKPNDPQYSRQWAMPLIEAEQAWNAAKPGSPVIIAVLDTGVDVNHPDLKGRLVPGTNTTNPLKSARDSEGHGTHVAGIAGAAVNNGIGVAGVAGVSGIKIMPVKVFDESGGSDISISEGIIWAADHGAKVINMSFGSFYHSEILNEAIDYAYGKGVVLVAAAGNWASEEVSYPAALAKVIAVSATDRNDKLAEFSSFGPQIDVSAPGDGIYSTVWDPYKGSTYTEHSGTSMASPMVAGLAALLLSQNPKLSNEDIRQIIEVSATDLGDPGWDPEYGHGRINVYKALTTSLKKQDDSNSVMEKAVNLKDGVPYREKISSGSDVDWFAISLPEKSSLQVEVLPAGNVTPGVEIYDSAGEVLSSFNTGEGLQGGDIFLPWDMSTGKKSKVAESVYGLLHDLKPGDYYIKVFGNHYRWSLEDYTVTATLFDTEQLVKDPNEINDMYKQAKTVSLGAEISGAILEQGDEDWYKVNLTKGAYKINVDVPEGLDLAVSVESSFNYSNWYSEEDYWNNVDKLFMETIDNSGQGQDEEGVILLPQDGGGTYYLRVYDRGGNSVNSNYTVKITGFNFRRDKFENNDSREKAARIELGEDVTANFDNTEDEDWYKVRVNYPGILEVNMKQPNNLWYNVEIYGGDGEDFIGESYYPGYGYGFGYDPYLDPEEQEHSFQYKVTPGEYYIRVFSYGPLTADNYNLSAKYVSFNFVDREINDTPLSALELTANVPAAGTLYPEADVDVYTFDVEKPQPYLVYLNPPKDLNTAVMVAKEMEEDIDEGSENPGDGEAGDNEDFDGPPVLPEEPREPYLEPLTEIDNGSKGQPDTGVFVATKPGRYYIAVTAVPEDPMDLTSPKSTGTYSLTVKPFTVNPDAWENNNTLPQAKAIKINVPVKPTFMGTEDTDWFKVYVPGKGRLNISLMVPDDIDGIIEVFDQTGKFVTRADLSMAGEEEFATVFVNKAGNYYIKTYDYLGNSSVHPYTLTASYVEKG